MILYNKFKSETELFSKEQSPVQKDWRKQQTPAQQVPESTLNCTVHTELEGEWEDYVTTHCLKKGFIMKNSFQLTKVCWERTEKNKKTTPQRTVCPSIAALCRPRTSWSWVKCWMKETTSAWKRWVCTYWTDAILRVTRISHSLCSNGSGRPYLW